MTFFSIKKEIKSNRKFLVKYAEKIADDIASLCSANKYEELKIKLEDDLQLLTNWTASIKLSINHEKTKAMLINILLDVRFENVKINFVDNFKYLGLILDKDLTFSLHIKRLKGLSGWQVGLCGPCSHAAI
jgi:hypothetical protein